MHQYAVFDHDRSVIGRWLATSAIVLSGLAPQFMSFTEKVTGWEIPAGVAITTGLIYLFLDWIFTKLIWKYAGALLGIPNISGKWKCQGKTLNEDGSTKYDWESTIFIAQNWKELLITQKTKSSESNSDTATIKKKSASGEWIVSYSYDNKPNIHNSHELNSHQGYCQITFDEKLQTGNAAYFNSNGRRTFGSIELTKEK